MKTIIEQEFFAIFRSKYVISRNSHKILIAKENFFHLPYKPELCLYDSSNRKILTLKLASPLFFEYDFIFENGEIYELRAESNASFSYSIQYKNSKFSIYFHSNLKISIFRNDIQVAYFEKDSFVDNYTIFHNQNEDSIILSAIVLAYDFHFHKGSISTKGGIIGWNLKKFDENWQPN